MTENSPAGLTLLAPDRTVAGTRGEHHQSSLRPYAPLDDGLPRKFVVELAFSPVETPHHQGRRGVEIRLDGGTVGELSALMSAHYGPLVEDVLLLGGRPACIAEVANGNRGVELELRLPEVPVGAVVPPESAELLPADITPAPPGPARRTPYLVGAGVAALLIVVGVGVGQRETGTVPAADGGPLVEATTTTTAAPVPTSTVPAATAHPTSVVPPARPAPRPAAGPVPEAEPEPSDYCDPNYGDCVPAADDVDCEDEDGDGPAYVAGPVEIIGTDVYDLDPDDDGIGCN